VRVSKHPSTTLATLAAQDEGVSDTARLARHGARRTREALRRIEPLAYSCNIHAGI